MNGLLATQDAGGASEGEEPITGRGKRACLRLLQTEFR